VGKIILFGLNVHMYPKKDASEACGCPSHIQGSFCFFLSLHTYFPVKKSEAGMKRVQIKIKAKI
jgi:hypothetical protein